MTARVQQAISERFILPGLQVFACVLRGLVNGLPLSLFLAHRDYSFIIPPLSDLPRDKPGRENNSADSAQFEIDGKRSAETRDETRKERKEVFA